MEVVLAVVVLLNELNLVGQEIPLTFMKGASLDIGIEVVNASKQPVNITGRTYTVKIGAGDGGAFIAQFTQVNTDPLNGLVNLTLATAPIVALTAGKFRWIAWENTRFLWRGPVTILSPDVV